MSIEEQYAKMKAELGGIKQQMLGMQTQMQNPYVAARSEFIGSYKASSAFASENPELLKTGMVTTAPGYVTSETGKLLYDNGVIFDPATGNLLTPPGRAVPGSYEWSLKIQDEWSDAKFNQWRKKLAAQGYEVAETGGKAYDVIQALMAYHQNRYANGGKVQPLTPGGAGAVGRGREIRESIDPVQLKEEVKGWGEIPFGEDLNENAADFLSERIIDLAARLAKENKSWTPEQALTGAQVRAQKQFVKRPGVKSALREAEEDEMDESLRQNIISLAQLGSL